MLACLWILSISKTNSCLKPLSPSVLPPWSTPLPIPPIYFHIHPTDPILNASRLLSSLKSPCRKNPHWLAHKSQLTTTTWEFPDYHVRKVKNTTECVTGTPYSEGKQTLLRVIVVPTPTIPTIDSDAGHRVRQAGLVLVWALFRIYALLVNLVFYQCPHASKCKIRK